MSKLTPYGWMVLAVAGCVVALVWSAHASDPASGSWTDPAQPPDMVALPVGTCGSRARRPARCCDYPASLSAWDGSVVGDC